MTLLLFVMLQALEYAQGTISYFVRLRSTSFGRSALSAAYLTTVTPSLNPYNSTVYKDLIATKFAMALLAVTIS